MKSAVPLDRYVTVRISDTTWTHGLSPSTATPEDIQRANRELQRRWKARGIIRR